MSYTNCLYLSGDRFLVHVSETFIKAKIDLNQGTQLVFLNVNMATFLVITNLSVCQLNSTGR